MSPGPATAKILNSATVIAQLQKNTEKHSAKEKGQAIMMATSSVSTNFSVANLTNRGNFKWIMLISNRPQKAQNTI